jgi:predicted AAA+ superfamily ATPase
LTGAARNLGNQVVYNRLAEGFSHHTITRAFDTLCLARLITKVPSCRPSGLPLGATASPKKFKAILVDTGLWQHVCGVSVDVEYAKTDLLGIYRGAMAEQFVGQEMLCSQDSQLYYWAREARSSSAEVDYVGSAGGAVVPVEVKSGAAGRLRSLHLLLESYPNIPRGVVLSTRPYTELPDQRLVFVPIYYAYSVAGGSG